MIQSTCVITPQDFSPSTIDPQRDRWTAGKLRHVIDALRGEPVLIVTDTMTGHAEQGVLVDVLPENRVVIDGHPRPRPVAHLDFKCGVIVPLTERGARAKWDALNSYRDEGTAAIRAARPEAEAAGHTYGKWSAVPGLRDVHVTYEPQREDAGGRYSKAVPVRELAAA